MGILSLRGPACRNDAPIPACRATRTLPGAGIGRSREKPSLQASPNPCDQGVSATMLNVRFSFPCSAMGPV